jgi:hypothetical protein
MVHSLRRTHPARLAGIHCLLKNAQLSRAFFASAGQPQIHNAPLSTHDEPQLLAHIAGGQSVFAKKPGGGNSAKGMAHGKGLDIVLLKKTLGR